MRENIGKNAPNERNGRFHLRPRDFGYYVVLFSLPMLLIGITGPLEIFRGNQGELFFGTGDFIWLFLGLVTSAVLCCAGIACIARHFLPEKITLALELLVGIFTLFAYGQNLFMNRQLMKTDGSKMDWSQYETYTAVNTGVWILGILLFVCVGIRLKGKMRKLLQYLFGFLSLVQLLSAVMILVTSPYSVQKDTMYVLSPEKQFVLGSEQNVIVLILDRYGNVTFDNAWERDAAFVETYKDFTYYTNANSRYNYTFPSIPYMMTLQEPDCTKTTNAYKELAWTEGRSREFYARIHEAGYDYRFYTGSGRACYLDASYLVGSVDNVVEQGGIHYRIDYKEMVRLFFKTSLYKFAPYIIKPYLEVQSFYFDGIVSFEGVEPCLEDNGKYYQALQEHGITLDASQPKSIVVQHLSGVHTPLSIDAEGNAAAEEATSLYEVQLGINKILADYFTALKEAGIYEKATIIITADHGQYKDALDPQPIYLIKPAGQQQEEMTYCEAPISSEDFLATLLDCIGEPYADFGRSIFTISENEERERQCLYPANGFEVYTYTGNREDLREAITDGVYTRIEATEDWD